MWQPNSEALEVWSVPELVAFHMEATQSMILCDDGHPMRLEPMGPCNEPHQTEGYQAMACLSCGLAGETPSDHFPQVSGLWDQPCPNCNRMTVWVTEVTDSVPEGH